MLAEDWAGSGHGNAPWSFFCSSAILKVICLSFGVKDVFEAGSVMCDFVAQGRYIYVYSFVYHSMTSESRGPAHQPETGDTQPHPTTFQPLHRKPGIAFHPNKIFRSDVWLAIIDSGPQA